MRRNRIVAPAGVALGIVLLLPGIVIARDQSEPGRQPNDITRTPQGRALAEDAAGRWAKQGAPSLARDAVVLQDDKGWVVAPKGVKTTADATGVVQLDVVPDDAASQSDRSAVTHHGQLRATSARPALYAPLRADAAGPASMADLTPQVDWELIRYGCASRYTAASGWGWIDVCWRIWQMRPDNESTRDHYLLEYWGTVEGRTGFGVEEAFIRAADMAGDATTYHWVDAAPRSSSSGGCRIIPLGVGGSYAGVGASISSSFQSCEQLDVTKGYPAVTMTVSWDYCQMWCMSGMRGSRELRLQEWVWVDQGKRYGWAFWLYVE